MKTARNDLLFYCLLVVGIAAKLYVVDSAIDLVDEISFQSYVRFFFYTIASGAILTLPVIHVGRRAWVILVFLVLLDIFLLSHLWYYRTYSSIIPWFAFGQLQNLDGLSSSILASIRPLDFLLPLLTIALMVSHSRLLRDKTEAVPSRTRLIIYANILAFVLTVVVGDLAASYRKNNTLSGKYDQLRFDPVEAAKYYGLLSCWLWQAGEMLTPGTTYPDSALAEIDKWLSEKTVTQTSYAGREQGKNLIIIIVEAMEAWPIGSRIGTKEITPFIDALVANEKRILARRVVDQTKHGRSSDTQVIINTGLLPIKDGSTFFRFPHNEYSSLAKVLAERHGYSTSTFMGNAPSFWNQSAISPSLGFSTLVSSSDFDMSDSFEMGLSDESFFNQSIKIIKNIPEPFYVQMITLSSHTPFKIPPERIDLRLPPDMEKSLSGYLKAINYVDKSIGAFVAALKQAGLFEQTVIVITGDHEALFRDKRIEILKDKYGKDIISKSPFLPFIVINSDTSLDYHHVMGQVDIYPTLLDLFDVTGSWWRGLGQSILREPITGFAANSKRRVFGDTTRVAPKRIIEATSAWKISDMIITSDWFRRKQIEKGNDRDAENEFTPN